MKPNDPGRDLALLCRARDTLIEVRDVGQAIEIVHQGHAAIRWAKSRRDVSLEAVNQAAEIVLRMERFIGSELSEMNLGQGKRTDLVTECDEVEKPTLSQLGVSRMQSHRWQAEAAVPEEDFTEWMQEIRDSGKQLTSGALVKLGRAGKHRKEWAAAIEPVEGTCETLQELIDAGSKFRCVYADPPWQYGNQQTRASTDNHYGTMTLDEICQEPVASVAADDAHLHLWTTNAFLFDAKRVMEAWGFEYRSCFVWVKPQMGIGNYWRVSHEFLLLGIRGKATNFLANDEKSWAECERTKHSRKPYDIRRKVERVSPGPYLEMYGREQVPGWTVYGNQIAIDLLA